MKRLWLSAGFSLCLLVTMGHAGDISGHRKDQLRNLVLHDCGSCHGLTMRGGLGRPLRPADLKHFDVATIARIVLDGLPGTPMPPWRGLLTEAEALWIAMALKNGAVR